MSRFKHKILWYNKGGVEKQLTDVERINITRGEKSSMNSADIFLKNPITERGSDGFLYPKHVNSGDGLIKFNEGDSIKIYAAYIEDNRELDVSITSADLLMSAEIQEVNVTTSEKGTKMKLSCVDKSYSVFNVIWSNNYNEDSVDNRAPLIIQNIVRWASSLKGLQSGGYDDVGGIVPNGIYGVDARLDTEKGFIETTRNDATGTAFPKISIARSFKPVYEWLDELSSSNYTNDFASCESETSPPQDRTMTYYIDELNRFHWFYPKDGITNTLNQTITATETITTLTLTDASSFSTSGSVQIGGEVFDYTSKSGNVLSGVTRGVDNTIEEAHASGDVVYSQLVITQSDNTTGNKWVGSKLTYKTYDIINAVIFNAGDDMNGSGILGFWFDKTSSSPKLKMVYKAWTHLARVMKSSDIRLAISKGFTGITHTDGDEYAYPTDYDDYGAGKKLPSWNPGDSTIVSDTTYNTALRTIATRIAKGLAKKLTAQIGSARWKGTITLELKRFTSGKLVRVNSALTGIRNKDLRIKKVQYNITNVSGQVTLTLEEDEKKQGE